MAEKPKLGELLVMAGAIDQTQLGSALADQRKFGQPLGSILVSMGYIDEETLVRTLARQLNLPIAWLRDKWVEPEVLELVPAKIAIKHHCLPLLMREDAGGKVLHLAMQDPGNLEALDAVSFQVGHKVTPVLSAASELEDAIQRHYQSGENPASASPSRPEVQNVPELLMFELKAQAATPVAELEFEFGTRARRRRVDDFPGRSHRTHAAPHRAHRKGDHQQGRGGNAAPPLRLEQQYRRTQDRLQSHSETRRSSPPDPRGR